MSPDRVLLQNTRKRTRKGEELDPHFTGPFTVIRVTNVNTAYVEKDGNCLKQPVSSSRLKLFKPSEAQAESENAQHQQPQAERQPEVERQPQAERQPRDERHFDFRPPELAEMKTMALKLSVREELVKNRPPFGEPKPFSFRKKPNIS
ncbi:hypothetical protein ACOMHN_013269 [Nucella lapillus]